MCVWRRPASLLVILVSMADGREARQGASSVEMLCRLESLGG